MMKLFLVAALTMFVTEFLPSVHAIGWNYDGTGGDLAPNGWQYNYSMCGGSSQSPIDINTATLASTTGSLSFSGYNTSPTNQNYTITNKGLSVQVNVNVKTISLTNSRVSGTLVLEQLHFHWGTTDRNGSEHSVNGNYYPMEVHLVHYNSDKYNNVSHAVSSNDSSALLVLGVFVSVSETNQSANLVALSKKVNQVLYQNNRTVIPSFPIASLLPTFGQCQQSTLSLFSYSGSLTTPACAQVVNWNIFSQPIYISSSQLANFRQIYLDNSVDKLTQNFRPVQERNGRTVYTYDIKAPGSCNLTIATNSVQMVRSGRLATLLTWLIVWNLISTS